MGSTMWAALGCGAVLLTSAEVGAVGLLGLQPVPGDTDVLSIETQPFSASLLGSAGLPSLSGLDRQPESGLLFASSGAGDGGRLFHVDPTSGQATLVGDVPDYLRVPGLAFDLDGTLFAAAGVGAPGELIVLDPQTGALVEAVGPFAADGFTFIDGLAVHPLTGDLYGFGVVCADADCAGAFSSDLFLIDKATGLATSLGALAEAGTGTPLACCPAGLAFDAEGNLFGSTGFAVDPTPAGRILSLDPSGPSPTYTVLGDTGDRAISDIVVPEPAQLWLALAALAAVRACVRGRLAGCGLRPQPAPAGAASGG